MTQRLLGKTAFITAAGQGIGRAIADAFVHEGSQVIATDMACAKSKNADLEPCFAERTFHPGILRRSSQNPRKATTRNLSQRIHLVWVK